MPIVKQNNGLVAEFAIFHVSPDRQSALSQMLAERVGAVKTRSGFVSSTILHSLDGVRVTQYTQWAEPDVAIASQAIAGFDRPDLHLFEIFASEPNASELELRQGMDGLINFGIFKLKSPECQPRFVELFRIALTMVAGQAGLISTHAHRSLDGMRCINFGHWRSLADFAAMDANRPFSPLFSEMLDLADNEYQKSLHEVVYAIDRP